MKGVIIARGKGSRMKYISTLVPKVLLPLASEENGTTIMKPMIEHILDRFEKIEVEHTYILVSEYSRLILDYLATFPKNKIFTVFSPYVIEGVTGFGAGLLFLKDMIKDDFVLTADDNLFDDYVYKVGKEVFDAEKPEAVLFVHRVLDPSKYGVIVGEFAGKYKNLNKYIVREIVEKPKERTSDLASSAVYFLKPSIFEALEKAKEEILRSGQERELSVADGIAQLIKEGKKVIAIETKEPWLNTGEVEHYILALEKTYKNAIDKINKENLKKKM